MECTSRIAMGMERTSRIAMVDTGISRGGRAETSISRSTRYPIGLQELESRHCSALTDVRFTRESGQWRCTNQCPLRVISRITARQT
jgi:hypothetical protein